jgi:hypothetical protein
VVGYVVGESCGLPAILGRDFISDGLKIGGRRLPLCVEYGQKSQVKNDFRL